MSNYIRSKSDAQQAIEGAALGLETYVHVRWSWLSLLVACVSMAFSFLVCAIFSTKKQRAGLAWKSSVLALLFHGLEESEDVSQDQFQTQTTGAAMRLVAEMEYEAQSQLVRLAEGADGTLKLRAGHS